MRRPPKSQSLLLCVKACREDQNLKRCCPQLTVCDELGNLKAPNLLWHKSEVPNSSNDPSSLRPPYDDEDEEIRAIICVTLAATFSFSRSRKPSRSRRRGGGHPTWRSFVACVWSQTQIPISILMTTKKLGEDRRGGERERERERKIEQVAITRQTDGRTTR